MSADMNLFPIGAWPASQRARKASARQQGSKAARQQGSKAARQGWWQQSVVVICTGSYRMPLLSHQLILHPDIVGQFVLQKPVTPYERRVGFTWCVCPVKIANAREWLLVNVEFGYCALADSGRNKNRGQTTISCPVLVR